MQRLQKKGATKYNREFQRPHHQMNIFKEKCQSVKEHAARKEYKNSLL